MSKLFECGCIGLSSHNYCPEHGKPGDTQRSLKRCKACNGRGRTQESMHEDECKKCDGTGYLVVRKKPFTWKGK